MINIAGFMEVIPKAILGWGQVFAVTAIIIAVTYLLNKITSEKK